jgi:hypothetical protein
MGNLRVTEVQNRLLRKQFEVVLDAAISSVKHWGTKRGIFLAALHKSCGINLYDCLGGNQWSISQYLSEAPVRQDAPLSQHLR